MNKTKIYKILLGLVCLSAVFAQAIFKYYDYLSEYGFISDILFCLTCVVIWKCSDVVDNEKRSVAFNNIASIVVVIASFSGLQEIHGILKDTYSIWLILSFVLLIGLMLYLVVKVIYSVKNIIKKEFI